MLVPLFLIPLFFAWRDLLRVSGQTKQRRCLALVGLILLSSIPFLSGIAMYKVDQAMGLTPAVIPLERAMFIAAAMSIPFLCFGYRFTRWFGIASAVVLPVLATFVDSLY